MASKKEKRIERILAWQASRMPESSESVPNGIQTNGSHNDGIPQIPVQRSESDLDEFRKTLPVANMKKQIIETMDEHPVVLICGETGSGKTTQIPQFILDDCYKNRRPCQIICTQPRRISAVAMAERVAAERGENVGETVGYRIRLESRVSSRTLLTFCTNGVLLRTLSLRDSALESVTHVIIDEVHERDKHSDFLLTKIKQLINLRSSSCRFEFKVILMSAAIDVDLFVNYFDNCPIITIPGRMYNVKQYYLEDVLKITGWENGGIATRTFKEWREIEEKESATSINTDEATDLIPDYDPSGELSPTDILPGTWESESMDAVLALLWQSDSEPVDGATGDRTEIDVYPQLFHLIESENFPVNYKQSETGFTALMIAALHGAMEECKRLISLGADTTLWAANGWTAAEIAYHQDHIDLAYMLNMATLQSTELPKESDSSEQPQTTVVMRHFESNLEMTENEQKLIANYYSSHPEPLVDAKLIMKLLLILTKEADDGAILIFLPGYDDIITLRDKIRAEEYAPMLGDVRLFILHSIVQSSSDQKQVFKPAPEGFRKIILSTNIAETSVTIEDVVYVIDSGKVKVKVFDAFISTTTLKSVWVSKSSALQRKGRAGRCRPGICFHMFSKATYNSMQSFQTAEILRTPIYELCLQAKLLAVPPNDQRDQSDRRIYVEEPICQSGETIADFLSSAPEAPSKLMIENSVNLLMTIGALDGLERLTELGHHLVDLPIDPKLGKMILYAVVLKCLDPVLTIACTLAVKDPFLLPQDPELKKQAFKCKMRFSADTYSDHMCYLRAFQAWQRAKNGKAFCDRNFLSLPTMEMVVGLRKQIIDRLYALRFVRRWQDDSGTRRNVSMADVNINSEKWAVVKGAICGSSYPNILRLDKDKLRVQSKYHKNVCFQKSSVLSTSASGQGNFMKVLSRLPLEWIVFDELKTPSQHCTETGVADCCTAVTPVCIGIFTGPADYTDGSSSLLIPKVSPLINDDGNSGAQPVEDLAILEITDWIKLKMNANQPSGIGQKPRTMPPRTNFRDFFGVQTDRTETPKNEMPEPSRDSLRNAGSAQPFRDSPRSSASTQPSRDSPRGTGSAQHSRFYSRRRSGRSSATFGMSTNFEQNYSAESIARTIEFPLTLPTDNFDDNREIEPLENVTFMSVLCNSDKNLRISQTHDVWVACPEEEDMLQSAFQKSTKVFLVVFSKSLEYLQGYARLTSLGTKLANNNGGNIFGWEKDIKQNGQELSAYFSLEWISKDPKEVEAPWTENDEKTIWEVDASEGQAFIDKLVPLSMSSLLQFLPLQWDITPNFQSLFPSQPSHYGMAAVFPGATANQSQQGSSAHSMFCSQISSAAQYYNPFQ